MGRRVLSITPETFPIAGTFTISRGSKTQAEVLTCRIRDGEHVGWGECVPYRRYGETLESVRTQIESAGAAIADGMDRQALLKFLPAGAARNAIDCALWDLEAKRSGTRVAAALGVAPTPLETAFTLSLDSPEAMGRQAAANALRPLLKIKLGGDADAERMRAVAANAPSSRIIIDANEGWNLTNIEEYFDIAKENGVCLIEQPLPASDDEALRGMKRAVPICADESVHDRASLARLAGLYDAVNIKLDKTGGLTEALELEKEARRLGFKVMVGCMVGTSLAMAPALIVAQNAEFVDLDGPLLLAKDREPGLRYEGSLVFPAEAALWG
jgi:L-alanine-DL-glutamate epimerase-like enolase superfamily enzyme